MRNSLADDVVFILMEFRNVQIVFKLKIFNLHKFSRTLDIKCSVVAMFKFCLILNYSNSVLLLRILLL